MDGQLRLNVILPIVLVAVLATAIGLFTLSRSSGSSGSSSASLTPLLHRPARPPASPVHTAKPRTAVKPANTAKAKPKQVEPKPAKPKIKLNPGLPPVLAAALRSSPVAVVSLVTPDSDVDGIATKEAAAGARAAGAAFVTVDVTNEKRARPFAVKLGVVEAPTVLVYKRPGELVVRLNGFADLDTVAQAADNAFS
jgi:hypothetical protein